MKMRGITARTKQHLFSGYKKCEVRAAETALPLLIRRNMNYRTAVLKEANEIYEMVQQTIKSVYPSYYPAEVVDFFCEHHKLTAITQDIEAGNVSIVMVDGRIVGTGSFSGNHITRVYVLPEYQGRGYGTFMVKTMEEEIVKHHNSVYLDASLPAAQLYEKLGYQSIKHEKYPVENGVVLAYEVMEKKLGFGEDPIYTRRSIRKFQDKAVDMEQIIKIIHAGRSAPSAKNRQPWKYILFTGDKKAELLEQMRRGIVREELEKAKLPKSKYGIPDAKNTLKIMESAPVILLVLNINGKTPFLQIDTDDRFMEMNDLLSIGASVQNMLLMAQQLGLGTLWIGNTCFAYDELTGYLKTDAQLVGAVAVGYQAEQPSARPRKSITDIMEIVL